MSESSGIRCPACSRTSSEVTDTRRGPNKLHRRRKCSCGHRFQTIEVIFVRPNHSSRAHVPTIVRMRNAGDTYAAIAKHLGVSLSTVWKRANGI